MTVPWEDDSQQAQQLRDQARQSTEAGKFPEAATLYRWAYDLQPSAFAICKEAKARRQWPLVLEFALALDRAKLSDDAQEQNGRAFPSNLQRWLYYVTRARLELEDYDTCLELAREGMERYPEVLFFAWWHALARIRQGNVEEGLLELQQVDRRFPRQWYIQRDLAETCEKLQRDEDAWRGFCEAALTPGELKGRIPMLARMAQPLERMERWPPALDHLLLAWALAAREAGWEKVAERYRQQVEAFEQRHAAQLGARVTASEAPPDPGPLLQGCRSAWRETLR